jgi:tRNA(Ile)-lysidine synthase
MPGPDPVAAAVDRWLAAHLDPVDPVIVACSGGADSLALAVATVACCAGGGRRLVGATVDHRLQPGSAGRAAATADVLTGLGVPEVAVLTVDVVGPGGPEAAARRARHAALRRLLDSLAAPGLTCAALLAHTADDQAETVLLGLARGSGPRSIAGMRSWRPPWGRPLLGVSRADTEATCRDAGLTPWQDPHNVDPAFTRVRLRHEVLPLLDEVLGGGVRAALGRTAHLMAQDLDALDRIAAAVRIQVTDADGSIDGAALAGHPVAVIARVLRGWAAAGGAGPLTFDQLTRMTGQITDRDGPSQVRVTGGLDVIRTGNAVRLALVGRDR